MVTSERCERMAHALGLVALVALFILGGCAGSRGATMRLPVADAPPPAVTESPSPPSEGVGVDIGLHPVIPRQAPQPVYFDFDQYSLRDDQKPILAGNLDALVGNLVVEGHCDERGTIEYNLALGERRALVVARWLRVHGMDRDRIRVISYGKERPADPGRTEAAWGKNRRCEFTQE